MDSDRGPRYFYAHAEELMAKKKNPQEICLICKKDPSRAQPGEQFRGTGSNGMMVTFFLHNACAHLLKPQPPQR
jgi:hypothetical protein